MVPSYLSWFVIILFCLALVGMVSPGSSQTPVNLPAHHTSYGFQNSYRKSEHRFGDFWRWRMGLGPEEVPILPAEEIGPYEPEVVGPNLNEIQHPNSDQMQITWVGHSTFLVQVAGINILTDPVFSDRCSPIPFLGVKRLVRPGIPFEKLPQIHAVLISHNHYDHLDGPTIERLGDHPIYLVPLGLPNWFERRNVSRVRELDWWQSSSFQGVNFHSVPIQHFSGRSPFDRNRTLWSGWVIESKFGKVFFAGDTGYSPVFQEIGERFGPIQVSMIPIGAYRPRWFMNPVHADPPQAVKIFKETRSEHAIAMHWGTFKLSDEPPGEPPLYLRKVLGEEGLGEEQFTIMKFGETLVSRDGETRSLNR